MGNSASRVARKVPKGTPSTRVVPNASAQSATRLRPERTVAFESKNEAIERDAKDPHFVAKLNQLGPVRVDHHTQTVRAANDAQNMYHSRVQSEAEAAGLRPAQNRLLASSLTELLEARKSVMNGTELGILAARYDVDAATLDRLTRVVNIPSIDESTVVRTMDKHGEESLTMMARWVDPVFSYERR